MNFNQRIREKLEEYLALDADMLFRLKPKSVTDQIAHNLVRKATGKGQVNDSGEWEYSDQSASALKEIFDRLLGRPATSADTNTVAGVDVVKEIENDPEYAKKILNPPKLTKEQLERLRAELKAHKLGIPKPTPNRNPTSA